MASVTSEQSASVQHPIDNNAISGMIHLLLAGIVSGVIAGLLYQFLLNTIGMSPMLSPSPAPTDLFANVLITGIAGGIFALTVGQLINSPGSGMVWGVSFGLILWLVGPVTIFPVVGGRIVTLTSEIAHDLFPLLIGLVVIYGATMGVLFPLILRIIEMDVPSVRTILSNILRALLAGSLAGFLGGALFGRWTGVIELFPLLAGFMGSESVGVGYTLHIIVAIVIGAIYGLLFRTESQNLGPSLIRGLVYGFVWWIVGSLTILPILSGDSILWTLEAAQETYGGLIGHLMYGVVLAFVYALISRLHAILFIESDPIRREPESPGTRSLRAIATGILASISGGLAFTLILISTNSLPTIGRLGGNEAVWVGFIVHMTISAIIGSTYGLFFSRVAKNYGSALIWGVAYGQLWWFLGSLTLMPLLLTGQVAWSLEAAVASYPSLMGHLLYGGTMALTFRWLSARFDPAMKNPDTLPNNYMDSSALWIAVLLPGILIPLLLTI